MRNRISMLKASDLTLNESFVLFLQRCQSKNLSEKTILDYKVKLQSFLDKYGELKTAEVTRGIWDEYIRGLQDGDIKAVSVTSYCRSVRAFLYYCMESGYINSFKVMLPRYERDAKTIYDEEQLSRLLKKPDKKNSSFAEFRNWTLICYLLGTGNRISTALSVKIGDVDFKAGYITLQKTKNRKAQIIPLSRSLADILSEYLTIRGGTEDEYLFCDTYGNQWSVSGSQTAIYRYNKRRGVEVTSLHSFRHSFAKSWIVSGGGVFELQKILGHANITTTQEYVSLYASDLKQNFEAHTALDRMNPKKKVIRTR